MIDNNYHLTKKCKTKIKHFFYNLQIRNKENRNIKQHEVKTEHSVKLNQTEKKKMVKIKKIYF